MPADRTMGGEHPLAAIKRLAHWEVEDDIGMLRTRLACISAQADKVTAAPPAPADRAALVERLRTLVRDIGTVSWLLGREPDSDEKMVRRLDEWRLRAHGIADALAAPPEFALTPEQVALHEQYVVDHGSDHDEDCPGDDTCTCSKRPRNDAVNAVCRYLSAASLAPDCRAAVRAALLEVREEIAAMPDFLRGADGEPSGFAIEDILDAKLAALERQPTREGPC